MQFITIYMLHQGIYMLHQGSLYEWGRGCYHLWSCHPTVEWVVLPIAKYKCLARIWLTAADHPFVEISLVILLYILLFCLRHFEMNCRVLSKSNVEHSSTNKSNI
jgi:hypothetical protein